MRTCRLGRAARLWHLAISTACTRGHQALIANVRAIARASGRPSGVLLLEPHPRLYFKPNEPYFQLQSLEEKLAVLDGLGLDYAIVLPFKAELARLTADEFIDGVLIAGLGVSHVVVGYHYFFGKGRGGTVETLREAGERHGFGVTVMEPVSEAGEVFSSTAIRLKLAEGNVRAAADALGRPWRVIGPVVGGAKRGTGMGYPTANVPMRPGTALGHGIYAVRVAVEGGRGSMGRPISARGRPSITGRRCWRYSSLISTAIFMARPSRCRSSTRSAATGNSRQLKSLSIRWTPIARARGRFCARSS